MRNLRIFLLVAIAFVASVLAAKATVQQIIVPARAVATATSAPLPSPSPGSILRTFSTPQPRASAEAVIPRPQPPRSSGRNTSGAVRYIHSATGSDIQITYVSGCGGGAYPGIVPVNCQITWKPINVSAPNGHDCFYAPFYNNAAAADGSANCQNGNSGVAHTITLFIQGTWILGSFNKVTNRWDELAFITVGTPPTIGTYDSSADTTPQSSFIANGSNTVYFAATGLITLDKIVFDISYASLKGNCVYMLGGVSADGYGGCNPFANPGVNAAGGQANASWTPPPGTPTGTYILTVTDISQGIRLASRQFSIVSSGTPPTVTFVPGGGNPSPAPAFTTPPSTDLGSYAYDGNDASTSKITVKTTAPLLTPTSTYIRTFSDPNGIINNNFGLTTNALTDGTGKIADATLTLAVAQTPLNFSTPTYTYSLLGPLATGPIVFANSFQILGYAMSTQFLNPQGTALTVGTGTATSSLQFTNTSDTVYGSGNGDLIQFMELKTAGDGSVISLNCGALCTSEIVSDSAGNLWTASVTLTGATYRLFLAPQANALPVGATLTVPNMTWTGPVTNCGVAGCKLTTSFVPQHGLTWTDTTKNASNPVYLVDNGAVSPSATGSIVLVGNEAHGYTPRSTQSFYEYAQPFAQTQQLSLKYTLTNVNSGGINLKAFRLTMPVGFLYSTMTVSAGGTAAWASDAASCSGLASNVFCFKSAAGIAAAVTDSVTFSVDAPKVAFSYTDVLGQVTSPGNYGITAANTPSQKTIEVGPSNPYLVDTTALGSYSLNATLMTFGVSSTGAGPTYAMTVNYTNTSSSADPFPDYVDALLLQVINGAGAFSAITTSSAGFTYEGPAQTNQGSAYLGGSNADDYWFGTCVAQRASAQPFFGNVTPCTLAQEQNSIAPGGALTINATYTDATGQSTAILWAHGANSNGWAAYYINLPLSGSAAYGGFQAVGTYGAPTTLSSGTVPTIGLDTDPTKGNSYVYRFNNQSGANVAQFSIQIPGLDNGGSNAIDTETTPVPWTLTTTPSFAATGSSGTNYGCVYNRSASATTGGVSGGILITGCTIPVGGWVDVAFAMKGPYNAGDKYTFTSQYTTKVASPCSTTVPYPCANNGATTEQWIGDQSITNVLAANLSIVVNPGAITGSTPVVVCAGCTFTANSIDFGTIVSDNTTHNYSDVVRVDLTTNASAPEGWKLYESVATNPTNVSGAPTNELQTLFDATHSNPTGGALTYTTVATVVPTSGNGALMVQTGGTNAQRTAFNMIDSFALNVAAGDALGARTPAVTFLFIAN